MKQVSVLVGAGSIGQAIIRRVSAGKHIVLADYSNESPYYDTVSWNDGNNHASKDGQRTTDERSKSRGQACLHYALQGERRRTNY